MEKQLNIDHILPLVQRPARYIGHEWNASPAKADGVSLCLCFPDLYEVGASNLGLEILYHLINSRDDARAERAYMPANDMAAALKKEDLPLFSLESRAPLSSFDVVGFTLQYELCATNILEMLSLSGIPLLAAERKELFPLVIGGGPMTANPEPLAEFFDAFVLGDGEEAVGDIIEVIKDLKGKVTTREELLLALAKIPGVYVPGFYRPTYNSDGTLEKVDRVSNDVPEKIEKRTVKLDTVFFPEKKIVPYLQTVHDRLNIEVARGCAGHCRFCQAAKYYWPWRTRPLEKVLALAETGIASTGFEEIAFSSLSCTDYKDLERLLVEINGKFGAKRISVSLPSLRCDQFSLNVAKNLGQNKRSSLTFAPEAGTDRLRDVIGKELSGSEIEETLIRAAAMGWKQIKLYFMVGLPTETDADIEGINKLVRSVRSKSGLNFTITVSPFVPKAQTPFQWVAMAKPEALKERMTRLSKILPASVKGHHVDSSVLEGVFARGDRRLSKVILAAWKKGCRFDQWKEHMQIELWHAAFKEEGIDPVFYLYRERGENEVLPWEHLVFGQEKSRLWAEYKRALETPAERPADAKAAGRNAGRVVPELRQLMPPTQTVQKLRLRFARRGPVRFLSHLEQIEVFRRALRRSGLPLAYTAGFSPQLKVSFGPAVSVGYESECEYIEMELSRRVETDEVKAKVQANLPGGFELLSVRKMPLFFPSLDSLLNVADYRIGTAVTDGGIAGFLSAPEIIVEKRKEKSVIKIDAKPLIRELKSAPDGGALLQMRFGPKRNVKPEKVMQLLLGLDENMIKLLPVTRTALLIEKKDGTISEP